MRKAKKQEDPNSGFYVVQPIPTDATHFKLGYSANVRARLKTYQSICPKAAVVRLFRCWSIETEHEAMNYLEVAGFERIGPEVFKCEQIEALLACLETFFSDPKKYRKQLVKKPRVASIVVTTPVIEPKEEPPVAETLLPFKLLKPEEVMARLGIDRNQLKRLVNGNILPALQFSQRTWRFHLGDVEAYERGEIQSVVVTEIPVAAPSDEPVRKTRKEETLYETIARLSQELQETREERDRLKKLADQAESLYEQKENWRRSWTEEYDENQKLRAELEEAKYYKLQLSWAY